MRVYSFHQILKSVQENSWTGQLLNLSSALDQAMIPVSSVSLESWVSVPGLLALGGWGECECFHLPSFTAKSGAQPLGAASLCLRV